MSSLATGRVYLSKSGALVFSLCGKLMEQSGDREGGRDEGVEGKIGRNALGAVQKLSLRYIKCINNLVIKQFLYRAIKKL